MEITVSNQVPSENILAGTLFQTVISRENLRKPFFLELAARKKVSQ
jgi:hypothetical protein